MKTPILHPVVVNLLIFFAAAAYSNDYHDSENLAASSAEDVSLGLDRIDKETERRPSREILEDLLAQAPPFWRDSAVDLRLRIRLPARQRQHDHRGCFRDWIRGCTDVIF